MERAKATEVAQKSGKWNVKHSEVEGSTVGKVESGKLRGLGPKVQKLIPNHSHHLTALQDRGKEPGLMGGTKYEYMYVFMVSFVSKQHQSKSHIQNLLMAA